MRKRESPVQWGLRVKSTLQYLLSRNEIAYTIVSACLQDLVKANLTNHIILIIVLKSIKTIWQSAFVAGNHFKLMK